MESGSPTIGTVHLLQGEERQYVFCPHEKSDEEQTSVEPTDVGNFFKKFYVPHDFRYMYSVLLYVGI